MKLVCPHCAKVVDVDDSHAGQTTSCPQCQGPFTVPLTPPPLPGVGTMNPLPPPPPPPPPPDPLQRTADWRATGSSVVPPAPSSTATPSGRPAWTSALQNVNVPPWVRENWTLIVLALLFLLQFFPWVGVYAGDYTLIRQSGVGIAFGSATVNDKTAMAFLTDTLAGAPLIALYFLATLIGFILFILLLVDRFVSPTALGQVKSVLDSIFARREIIALVLLGLTGLILLLYLVISFPLEHAVQTVAQAPAQTVNFYGVEVKPNELLLQAIHRRCWFTFAFLVNFIAGFIVVYRWLQGRGYTRNWPRISVQRGG